MCTCSSECLWRTEGQSQVQTTIYLFIYKNFFFETGSPTGLELTRLGQLAKDLPVSVPQGGNHQSTTLPREVLIFELRFLVFKAST